MPEILNYLSSILDIISEQIDRIIDTEDPAAEDYLEKLYDLFRLFTAIKDICKNCYM